MLEKSRLLAAAALLALLHAVAGTAAAEPFSPGQVFSRSFDMQGVEYPAELGVPDSLGIHVVAEIVQPPSSFTVRVFDRGNLLGTYTQPSPLDPNRPGPVIAPTAFFVGAESSLDPPAPFATPTTIEFSAFQMGTFDGWFEFTISDGLLSSVGSYWHVFLGTSDPADGTATGILIAQAAPVPEPSTMLLLLSGLGTLGYRCRQRLRRN
jgi:hypothetical protein